MRFSAYGNEVSRLQPDRCNRMFNLEYPEKVIPPFRYQYCPMCKTPLIRRVIFDDNIPMVTCPACNWIYTQSNVTSVVSVVTCKEGIVTILPPGLPAETPAALPAGLIEYGESPEDAAIRETREETGLESEIVRSLGWIFVRYFAGWPGPMVQFMYEARRTGGELRGSQEGMARIYPIDAFPGIVCPERTGSWNAINAYLAGKK
jgi:ADP-ribose pyrophosphatase YjhB (NUDIX family)